MEAIQDLRKEVEEIKGTLIPSIQEEIETIKTTTTTPMAAMQADITYLKEAVTSILNIVGKKTISPEQNGATDSEPMEEDPNGPIKRSARIANLDQTDYRSLSKGTSTTPKKKPGETQQRKK